MVISIEPGVYIRDENIGVRIEDMVLVTADGHRILTDALPKEARRSGTPGAPLVSVAKRRNRSGGRGQIGIVSGRRPCRRYLH